MSHQVRTPPRHSAIAPDKEQVSRLEERAAPAPPPPPPLYSSFLASVSSFSPSCSASSASPFSFWLYFSCFYFSFSSSFHRWMKKRTKTWTKTRKTMTTFCVSVLFSHLMKRRKPSTKFINVSFLSKLLNLISQTSILMRRFLGRFTSTPATGWGWRRRRRRWRGSPAFPLFHFFLSDGSIVWSAAIHYRRNKIEQTLHTQDLEICTRKNLPFTEVCPLLIVFRQPNANF